MKSEKENESLDQSSPLTQISTKTCISAKPVSILCFSRNCNKTAYICGNKDCECLKEHTKCPQILVESIMNNLKSKVIHFENLQESILYKIDKTIDQLSGLKDKIESQIKSNSILYGLTSKDKNLLNAFNKCTVSGMQIYELFSEAIIEENLFIEKESLEYKFEKFWMTIDAEVKSKQSQLVDLLESLKNNEQFYNTRMLKDSKVASDKQSLTKLLKMFGDKTPHSAKLLYRASQNDFQVEKFHQKCDSVPHTLTLCETINGRIIGGYTPLVWNKTGTDVTDQSGRSFIFSLTNNHKFILGKNKSAIHQSWSGGPSFGGKSPDLFISNSANQSTNSSRHIQASYFNENYIEKQYRKPYTDFLGTPDNSASFKTKQWQVWQLQFKQ